MGRKLLKYRFENELEAYSCCKVLHGNGMAWCSLCGWSDEDYPPSDTPQELYTCSKAGNISKTCLCPRDLRDLGAKQHLQEQFEYSRSLPGMAGNSVESLCMPLNAQTDLIESFM